MPPAFQDDKSAICIPFIINHLAEHQNRHPAIPRPPLFVGLNGLQGVGKTTLVSPLAATLHEKGYRAIVCSIDDFYLKHDDQVALADKYPDNALVQHRGEPGTHDIKVATTVINALLSGSQTAIPKYDKAAFSGKGDRLPESQWERVDVQGQQPVDIVIFEGWSVGFKALDPAQVAVKWEAPSRTLRNHKLEHLQFINDSLVPYAAITDRFDIFIHIDAEDTQYVYTWRQQQEEHLRETKGDPTAGMTAEEVVTFVDGYFPGYELYTDDLRKGVVGKPSCQLRLIVGKDRKVCQTIVI